MMNPTPKLITARLSHKQTNHKANKNKQKNQMKNMLNKN